MTVVAWVFVALTVFATLMTAFQNVLSFTVFPLDEDRQQPLRNPNFRAMPAAFRACQAV